MSAHPSEHDAAAARSVLLVALGLAMASAVSLGLARFAYALLLPPMRADLGWSYFTAGAMNTLNAAGYLAGALMLPRWVARFDARHVVIAGGIGCACMLALHGLTRSDFWLYTWRFGAGLASAASFAGGGLLAAQLAQGPAGSQRSGLVLGIYYGGTGLGIVASSWWVPWVVLDEAKVTEGLAGWAQAWVGLAVLAALCTLLLAWITRSLRAPPVAPAQRQPAPLRSLVWGLFGYLMFGLGYIGYMTFIITLLREQGMGGGTITAFYTLLGLGVVASSWLWAGLLQRHKDGKPLALLNALLAVATVIPVLGSGTLAVFVSGALFGSVFLSVVASTTALVRHNLPREAWPSGIAAYTIIFAAGQIVGPVLVGWVADGAHNGLAQGLLLSAGLLAVGSVLALRQKTLA